MSFVPELLGFGVYADISQAEEDLLRLGESGGSAAAGLEEKLGGASDGMKALGKESSKTSRGIQGLASVVSLVDPRLGQVIRSVGTLTRGLSVLRLGMGPAAIAVGAVVLALHSYQKEQERAARVTEQLTAAAGAQQRSQDSLAAAYEDLNAELSETARKEQEVLNIRRQAFAEALPGFQELAGSISSTKVEISSLNDEYMQLVQAGADEIVQQNVLDRINESAQRLRGMETQQRELIENMREEIDVREQILTVQRDQEAAAKHKAQQEQQQQIAAQALAELKKIERDAALALLSEEDRLLNTYLDQAETIRRLGEETGNRAAAERALNDERLNYEAQLEELRQQQHDQEMARIRERFEREAFEAEKAQSAREQRQQTMIGIYGNLADAAITAAEKRAAGDEAAAARAKATAKALGLTEVAIARAVGIQNAIARNAGRPAATALAVATQIAAAIQQTAAIAAAHQGARLAPDEVQDPRGFRRLVGERDNGPGQVLSPEASRRLERGESAASPMVAVPVFQHFGLFFPDYIQGPGTPLNDELNSSRDTGRSVY